MGLGGWLAGWAEANSAARQDELCSGLACLVDEEPKTLAQQEQERRNERASEQESEPTWDAYACKIDRPGCPGPVHLLEVSAQGRGSVLLLLLLLLPLAFPHAREARARFQLLLRAGEPPSRDKSEQRAPSQKPGGHGTRTREPSQRSVEAAIAIAMR